MLIRYVTGTGRLGRVLADDRVRILGIDHLDRLLVRVGVIILRISEAEIGLLTETIRDNDEFASGQTG
jgi:hypothetical protein